MIPHPSEALEEKDDIEFECEKDELVQVLSKLLESGILKSHRKGLLSSSVPNSVTGAELLSFLEHIDNEAKVGDELVQSGLLVSLSGERSVKAEALLQKPFILQVTCLTPRVLTLVRWLSVKSKTPTRWLET